MVEKGVPEEYKHSSVAREWREQGIEHTRMNVLNTVPWAARANMSSGMHWNNFFSCQIFIIEEEAVECVRGGLCGMGGDGGGGEVGGFVGGG